MLGLVKDEEMGTRDPDGLHWREVGTTNRLAVPPMKVTKTVKST